MQRRDSGGGPEEHLPFTIEMSRRIPENKTEKGGQRCRKKKQWLLGSKEECVLRRQ